jgi:hypothetical protein
LRRGTTAPCRPAPRLTPLPSGFRGDGRAGGSCAAGPGCAAVARGLPSFGRPKSWTRRTDHTDFSAPPQHVHVISPFLSDLFFRSDVKTVSDKA